MQRPTSQDAKSMNATMIAALLDAPPAPFREGQPVIRVIRFAGRKSGAILQTPLGVLQVGGTLHLVSPEAARNWVRNVESAGWCEILAGQTPERYVARRLSDGASVPILKTYVGSTPGRVSSMFRFSADATDAEVLAAAPGHAVFQLDPA